MSISEELYTNLIRTLATSAASSEALGLPDNMISLDFCSGSYFDMKENAEKGRNRVGIETYGTGPGPAPLEPDVMISQLNISNDHADRVIMWKYPLDFNFRERENAAGVFTPYTSLNPDKHMAYFTQWTAMHSGYTQSWTTPKKTSKF